MGETSCNERISGFPSNDSVTEDQLILQRAINEKDKYAFAALYGRYHLHMVRYIARRINFAPDAEDLAQDIFTRLWETRAQYQICKTAQAYLLTVANHAIARYLQRRKRFCRSIPVEVIAEEIMADGTSCYHELTGRASQLQLHDRTLQALLKLPPPSRAAVRLRFVEGLSTREAAHVAGCSVAAFYSRLERTLRILRRIELQERNR